MERSIKYHMRQLEQLRGNLDVLISKPMQHELEIIEIAARHHRLRHQIKSAILAELQEFDADTYKQTTTI